MIWLLGIYVGICAIQCGFQVWRDVGEIRRRASVDAHNRRRAAEDHTLFLAFEDSNKRMAESIERLAKKVETLQGKLG